MNFVADESIDNKLLHEIILTPKNNIYCSLKI